MKIKASFIIILLICGLSVQAQNNIFEKLSNHKDVTTVFVSKSLLSLMPNIDAGGVDLKSLTEKLEQVEIYRSDDNKNAAKVIRKETESLAKSKAYETLMNVKEPGENITFYAKKDKDSDKIKDLVMFVNKPNNKVTLIRIMGNFTPEDIQKVISGTEKKK
ncbi:hypothetical protein M2451_000126 [Dysgonomonas sp. PFB1-18]|uniref:DUF4252 domain-containing protein n=1 Tax=unclassified Dysgonomonas TaxID=2630389 RepID=UPI002475E9C3|nr:MULTISPECIES: DUF4252 domain-containing protein [unclassified Dysgonomonas]MDH6307677.1 hypothetical protein [Dysgonomonas sp. PF1-14]MDH6337595.1 hypothetical protein [Dysgonomonas sp. PF1-16]MDH6378819.1 hypothetical protein [Dysgonomonas sp. PFB1-18]MDH6396454.1 hypothetical protein [Dysgonomonas sp. PF1-23]